MNQFIAVASRRLRHLFPDLPDRSAFHKRRLRLSDVMERLIAHFARGCPGFYVDPPASTDTVGLSGSYSFLF
jgi:hypothetical protein